MIARSAPPSTNGPVPVDSQKQVGAGRGAVDTDQEQPGAGGGVMRVGVRSVELRATEPFESGEVARASAEDRSADRTGRRDASPRRRRCRRGPSSRPDCAAGARAPSASRARPRRRTGGPRPWSWPGTNPDAGRRWLPIGRSSALSIGASRMTPSTRTGAMTSSKSAQSASIRRDEVGGRHRPRRRDGFLHEAIIRRWSG